MEFEVYAVVKILIVEQLDLASFGLVGDYKHDGGAHCHCSYDNRNERWHERYLHFRPSLVNNKDRHSFWAVSCCLWSFRKNVRMRSSTGLAVYCPGSQLIIVVIFIAGQIIRLGVHTAASQKRYFDFLVSFVLRSFICVCVCVCEGGGGGGWVSWCWCGCVSTVKPFPKSKVVLKYRRFSINAVDAFQKQFA